MLLSPRRSGLGLGTNELAEAIRTVAVLLRVGPNAFMLAFEYITADTEAEAAFSSGWVETVGYPTVRALVEPERIGVSTLRFDCVGGVCHCVFPPNY